MASLTIVYYISGHGYGHAIRSIQIIQELLELGVAVIIKSTTPDFLFSEGLSRPVQINAEGFDVGLHQIDNIRFDLAKTKEGVKALLASAEDRIKKERIYLSDQGVSGVVSDIPFIPLAAAARSGLPSIGISNFSWDWIYSFYVKDDPEWLPLVKAIAGYYREGGFLLRLPFHGEMSAFPRIEDIPLVARRSRKGKIKIRQDLGLPFERKIGLMGFSCLDLRGGAIPEIARFSQDYLFLIRPPLNWKSSVFRKVEEGVPFADLVCASDFVITKPGYGMVADCLSHGTPMIYSDRGEFPEYPILVEGIKSHLACCHMPNQDLYSGHWGPYLEDISRQPRLRPQLETDGARVAAQRIVEWIEIRGREG
jgi:hypothetical protein